MAEPIQPRSITDQIILAFGLITIVSTSLTFYVLIPGIYYNMATILGLDSMSYILFSFTPSTFSTWALIIVTAILVAFSLVTILPTSGTRRIMGDSSDDNYGFFRYLAVFVFVQLILSLLGSYMVPNFGNLPIYNENSIVQNFFFSVGSVFQTVILQFIPLTVMVGIYLVIRRKFSIRAILNPNRDVTEFRAVFIIVATAVAALVFSNNLGNSIMAYVTFLVLNIIYMRFGFLKSLLAGFAITEFNVVSELSVAVPYLPTALSVYLFIWAFFGLLVILEYISTESAKRRKEAVQKQEEELPEISQHFPRVNPDRLFVRSSCPECGRATYHVKQGMTLVCDYCNHELSSDAVGEYNIKIESRYINRI